MSFEAVREYFRSRIAEVDSSFRVQTNAENIPNNVINGSYHIQIGTLTGGNVNQNSTEDTIQVQVRLFYSRGEDPSIIDRAMDQGNAVRLNAMSPKKVALVPPIKRVFCSSVEPISRTTNDSTLIIVMNFIVRVAYALG